MSLHELSLKQLDDKLNDQIAKEANDYTNLTGGVGNAEANSIGNRVNRLFNPDFSLTAKGANLTNDPGIGWSHAGNITYLHSFTLSDQPNAGTPRIALMTPGSILTSPAVLIESGHAANTIDHSITASISARGNGVINLCFVTTSGITLNTADVTIAVDKFTPFSFIPVKITSACAGAKIKIRLVSGNVDISLVNAAWGTAPVAILNNDYFGEGYFKSLIDSIDTRVVNVENTLPNKSDVGHPHVIANVTNLQAVLDNKSNVGHLHLISDVNTLQAALDLKSNTNHGHSDLVASIATKHNKTGDEFHDGGFRVSKVPNVADDVVRLEDLNTLAATIGPGSTIDSGYALVSGLAYAWVRGESVWFSPSVQPSLVLKTPITFGTIFSYALSTENSEDVIYDNDSWWQMSQGYGGNTFPVFAQNCGNSGLGGWQRPVLYVIGTLASHTSVITNQDLSFMAGNGQTYPLLKNIVLNATGTLGVVSWNILGITGGASADFISGHPDQVQVSLPSVGTFDLTVKVTDSTGGTATKTIHLTLTAYQVITLAIVNGNFDAVADSYPFPISSDILTVTGGTNPITWSVVSGSGGTANTLQSPTIESVAGGKVVTGTVNSAGYFYVNVQATDSASSPQTVSKALRVHVTTYIEPDPTYCFEADCTYVLMGDGQGKLLKDIRGGDFVLTTSEGQHERGGRDLSRSLVTGSTLVPSTGGEPQSVIIQGLKATEGHHWATLDGEVGPGGWTKAKEITETTNLITIKKGIPVVYPAGSITRGEPVQMAGNLETMAKAYYVSATPKGPWFLVHNMQIRYPSYD